MAKYVIQDCVDRKICPEYVIEPDPTLQKICANM